ncbi:MAG: extracellular solute-binding protein [Microcella sp.]|uniref:extracellular solute-binding protein n=1 Tax=Microcella sp. TaxID=1913979 RepID=UPI0024C84B9B|nr:extracellular solute-binding protein [Microcella sp.]UYN82521.1 MAG: extracellular solute-binding protein [Microcella sp.]
MKLKRGLSLSVAFAAAAALMLSACTAQQAEEGQVLRVWYQQDPNGPMGQAYQAAAEIFERENPGVRVEFEEKSFEQMRQSGSLFVNSASAPDVLEYNKGTSSTGLLVQQGLITNLTEVAEEYGWDDMMSPSLATTQRYQPNGIMGSGDWYAITNHLEFLLTYYNLDMFEEVGVEIPSDLAGLEAAMQAFVDAGITPLALSGAEYPAQHLWYELALSQADRDFVTAYQTYTDDVDFSGPEFTFATETIRDWVERGFISSDSVGLRANDMAAEFSSGRSPIMISGTWWYGGFIQSLPFEWEAQRLPGNDMHVGSGGNVWIVPEGSQQKDLAYAFIDATLRPEIQQLLGDLGGIPIAAENTDAISDPKSRALIEIANEVTEGDGLAFYPDWPVSGFYDILVAQNQALLEGSLTTEQFLAALQSAYDAHVATLNL